MFVKILSRISAWEIVVITRPFGCHVSKARILVAPFACARSTESAS